MLYFVLLVKHSGKAVTGERWYMGQLSQTGTSPCCPWGTPELATLGIGKLAAPSCTSHVLAHPT